MPSPTAIVNDLVRKMARVILQNPSASGRELADALGYSEPKSIYYWLRKEGVRGVRDLRRRVLRGEIAPAAGIAAPAAGEAPVPYGHTASLPLAVSLTDRGEPVFGDAALTAPTLTAAAFALHWQAEAPIGGRSDGLVLVVDPKSNVSDGDLILGVDVAGNPRLWRAYGGQADRLYVAADDPHCALRADASDGVRVVGRIRQWMGLP